MGEYPGCIRLAKQAAPILAVLAVAQSSLAWTKPAPAAPPPAPMPPSVAVQQIEDTERAFAQAVAQSGIAAGFRQFAAPDAVLFLPDPVPAGPELAGARWAGEFLWRPQYVAVAPSGDLAFSAGPSLLRGARPYGGFYLTVWKRQPDGSWKFLLDHAVDMPPIGWSTQGRPLVTMDAEPLAGAPSNEGLREADSDLNMGLPKGAAAAFSERLDDQAILARADRPVAQGRKRALALVADSPAPLEASTLGGSRSTDGGFGYTYGRARWSGPAGPKVGYYVRVWRATPQGWRLLADELAER
jgi:ketosteroid isomerase-like protein